MSILTLVGVIMCNGIYIQVYWCHKIFIIINVHETRTCIVLGVHT